MLKFLRCGNLNENTEGGKDFLRIVAPLSKVALWLLLKKKCEWLESAIGDIVSTQEAAPEFSIRNYVLSPKTEEENIDRLDRQENCMVV